MVLRTSGINGHKCAVGRLATSYPLLRWLRTPALPRNKAPKLLQLKRSLRVPLALVFIERERNGIDAIAQPAGRGHLKDFADMASQRLHFTSVRTMP